jgi:TolB-like protein/class 3 adenylate cyclase/tetratricopeptide (TPR) repeat protein
MERKLTAILAADVVGYTRLMERDEAGTFERLSSHRKDLFEPEIEKHHGHMFKLMGDGLLAEFGSVVDAVECAVTLQRSMKERNASVPDSQRIDVRIGINLGEVIVDGDDRYGEGVNIASRLQQIAEPGGICVSEKVSKEVEKKLAFGFEPIGEHRVKNIAEPIQVYRVAVDGVVKRFSMRRAVRYWRSARPIVAAALLLLICAGAWYFYSRPQSPDGPVMMAVLPFSNMSGDPSLQYFVDGTTEDLITALARSPYIRVIARTSTNAYKDKSVDVRQIGKELGARYVLEGSVQKSGATMRIISQLIDAKTGDHVWADRYDREGTDPFSLQDDITTKIINTLSGDDGLIRKKEYEDSWGKDTGSLAEYDYYLQGHDLHMRLTKEDSERAIEVWKEGLEKYPDSALLKVKLGWGYTQLWYGGWSTDPQKDLETALNYAQQGLAGNPPPLAKSLGHWLMADLMAGYKKDFDRALQELDVVRQLMPNDMAPINSEAYIPIQAGKPELAIEELKNITPQDPYADFGYGYLSWAYFATKDYEKSIVYAKAAPQVTPSYSLVFLAASYSELGKMDEARDTVKQLLAAVPDASLAMMRDLHFNRDQEVMEREIAALRKAGLPEEAPVTTTAAPPG